MWRKGSGNWKIEQWKFQDEQKKQTKKRIKKNKDNLRDPWGNIKYTNKHIKGPRKRRERKREKIVYLKIY